MNDVLDGKQKMKNLARRRAGLAATAISMFIVGTLFGGGAVGVRYSYAKPKLTCQTCHNKTTTPQADLTSYGKYRRFHRNHI